MLQAIKNACQRLGVVTLSVLPGYAACSLKALAAAKLPALVLAAPAAMLDEGPDTADRVLNLFKEAVVVDELHRDIGIAKWQGPITISLHGAFETYEPYVQAMVEDLMGLTGLEMSVVTEQTTYGNIDIYLAATPGYWPRHLRPIDPNDRIFTCAAAPHIVGGRIERSLVKINAAALSRETVEACLLEEVVQSLGLVGESTTERETILNDEIGYRSLGLIDRLLLEVLYDPRLVPGTASVDALPIAGAVLAEKLGRLHCAANLEGRRMCRL